LSFFTFTWRPRAKKSRLKVCEVRITFNYRHPYVSHYWRSSETIEFEGDPRTVGQEVTGFTMTAAR
jgi:hypothetical protein